MNNDESKKQMDEEILFHYTNEVGLQGILQNKCLWATDASATNDKSEMVLGGKLFEKMIREWLSKKNRSCLGFSNLIYTTEKTLENYFKGIFLTCFSTTSEGDVLKNGLLSQWRGYGSYAIKFKKDVLLKELKNWRQEEVLIADLDQNVRYYYDSESDYEEFKKDNSLKIDEFKEFISTDEWIKIEKKLHQKEYSSEDEDNKIVEAIVLALTPRFFVKHKGFHEERERRIVAMVPSGSKKGLHFHAPYKRHIKLFEEDPAIIENAVKEIIIGPMGDQKAAKNWVDSMLREFGYKNVEVKCSEIPFIKS